MLRQDCLINSLKKQKKEIELKQIASNAISFKLLKFHTLQSSFKELIIYIYIYVVS